MVKYNNKIATEGPMTFVHSIFGKTPLFNMTMTKYPEFRPSDQMIELHMDGRFVDSQTFRTIDAVNSVWQPRVNTKFQKEQFFIHESTINSFLAVMTSTYNLMLKNEDLSTAIIQAFPELMTYFGADAVCEVALTPKNVKMGHTVTI